MKKESMRKYSLLGLVLIGASAVTAAVLPQNNTIANNGDLIASGSELTCQPGDNVNPVACTITGNLNSANAGNRGLGSRTTSGDNTSSITQVGPLGQDDEEPQEVKSITESGSPQTQTFDRHTSDGN